MTATPLPAHLGGGLGAGGWLLLAAAATWAGLLGWWYLRGLRRVLAHPQGRRRHRWRPVALLLGVVSVLTVTTPPLGGLLEQRLSGHMAQHLVLIVVAAPLLALASPGQALLAGMPRELRRWLTRVARRRPVLAAAGPHVAWAAHIAALWLWHLPAAYDAALGSPVLHLAEHASFLGTAWLFWWHLVAVGRRRLHGPAAAFYVASAIPPGAALGAVLTFPDQPLYPEQAARAAATGLDPLLDQRIGGLVMWIPLDFAYLALAVLLFSHWLRRLHRAGCRRIPLRAS